MRCASNMLARACALSLAGVAIWAAPASATKTYTVSRGDDPGLNVCSTADCSLRGAVIQANSNPGVDIIRLPAGTYNLSIPRTSYPTFGDPYKGDLDIQDPVHIIPNVDGASVVIDAHGNTTGDRAFELNDALTLEDAVVQNGLAPIDGDNVARGGGFKVNEEGYLSMQNGEVGSNSVNRAGAVSGEGGGIWATGVVRLYGVRVHSNQATGPGFGGGLYFYSTADVLINASTLHFNTATFGAGISGRGGTLSLYGSRVGRNDAGGSGGGLFLIDGSEAQLKNTNVDNNTVPGAPGYGGGIRAVEASARLESTTVTKNIAAEGGGISISNDPGGFPGQLTLKNSIVAGNMDSDASDGLHEDCRDQGGGNTLSEGGNLVGYQPNCVINALPGDQIGGGIGGDEPPIIPVLQGEGFYGGMNGMLSTALDRRSPAVDAVPKAADCPATDIRGVPRPQGPRCDSGAYELAYCGGKVVNRVGTSFVDTSSDSDLEPTDQGDGVLGLKGSDSLAGAADNDGLCGGGGNDTLKGGDGNDKLIGGRGDDVCVGGPGADEAVGCEVERSIP